MPPNLFLYSYHTLNRLKYIKVKTENLQKKIDSIIYAIFGKIIPKKIRPNHFTIVRFLLIPPLILILINGNIGLGLLVFILAASTDFLDGTLARKRNQITDLGKVIDPIADKLLIGTMLYFIGTEYLIVKIFLIVILFEIIAALTSGFAYRLLGRPVGANIYGKIKMVLQSLSIALFLCGVIIKLETLIEISIIILAIALLFAIFSGIEQTRIRLKRKLGQD